MPSDDYIMGFIEGEGCFSCAIEKYTDYVPRETSVRRKIHKAFPFRVMPSFRIGISKKDSNDFKKGLKRFQKRTQTY